jgi:hypothetical protein
VDGNIFGMDGKFNHPTEFIGLNRMVHIQKLDHGQIGGRIEVHCS